MTTSKKKAQNKRQHRAYVKKRASQPLTKMDIKIIKLICKEKTSAEIAAIIGRKKRTVEGHRLFILKKIGCRGTAGIVMYAVKNKIV